MPVTDLLETALLVRETRKRLRLTQVQFAQALGVPFLVNFMTSQIPDSFHYNGEQYELVAFDGEKLITPQDYGMNPEMLHTACYRGFYSTYEITNEGLFLKEMTLGEVEEGLKPIQGIMPTPDRYNEFSYKELNLLTPFTGRIQLGKDLIQELYVHMGYQKPSAYQTLLEFTFAEGKLVSAQDLSLENAQKRGAFKQRFETGNIVQGIEEAFSLDIDLE